MSEIASELTSHYVLFSCEGTAEGVVIERLCQDGKLIVPRERVVDDTRSFRPFTRLRKAKDIEARFFAQDYANNGSEGLLVARIVDSRNTHFALSRHNKDTALVRAFVTAPEIEMLVIHAEDAYDAWQKEKTKHRDLAPNEFCKGSLGLKQVKEEGFLQDYWADSEKLVAAIRAYASKLGKRRDQELVLADLLR